MYFKTILLVLSSLKLAAADCNHNNCLRAVIASAVPTRHGAADCSSYLAVTVTPAASTVTTTTTVTATTVVANKRRNLKLRGNLPLNARQATVTASSMPAYASACTNKASYSSACSCIGVTAMTITAAAPTTTVTQTATATVNILQNPSIQFHDFKDEFCGSGIDSFTLSAGHCFTLPLFPIPDFSNSWSNFDPGLCGVPASQCTVGFYTNDYCFDFDRSFPVTSNVCVDASYYFSARLNCGPCV
ncbi:hypothetical protein TWF694_005092 [Orbilia ellipsospora]|uniref:Uncharacterized protein n=1 Tax=Orbilia ellipsospora TaxID=2528407 RepID=A0AAV9WUL2_9PEZI